MRKHGIDLEDTTRGDGLRPKRLDRKDLDALMGGDGQGGIFTWREKNRRKVSTVPCSLDILVPVLIASHTSAGIFRVCTISPIVGDSAD